MTVKEQIVERVRACGYDFITACEFADKTIADFKAGGRLSETFGIMGTHGKCLDAFELRRPS